MFAQFVHQLEGRNYLVVFKTNTFKIMGNIFAGINVNDRTFSFVSCLNIEEQLTQISKLTSEVSCHRRDKKVEMFDKNLAGDC